MWEQITNVKWEEASVCTSPFFLDSLAQLFNISMIVHLIWEVWDVAYTARKPKNVLFSVKESRDLSMSVSAQQRPLSCGSQIISLLLQISLDSWSVIRLRMGDFTQRDLSGNFSWIIIMSCKMCASCVVRMPSLSCPDLSGEQQWSLLTNGGATATVVVTWSPHIHRASKVFSLIFCVTFVTCCGES